MVVHRGLRGGGARAASVVLAGDGIWERGFKLVHTLAGRDD